MVLGGPGAGKSNICNKLVGEKFFKSESSSESGVTKEITFLKRPALGKKGATMLNVADLPGLCDLNLPLAKMINEIKTKIGSLSFDAVLIIVK
jgi:ribosome biogenesis GTPase A